MTGYPDPGKYFSFSDHGALSGLAVDDRMTAITAIQTPPAGLVRGFIANKALHPFRPLGHPTISTGSPRVFHWVTQGFPLGHPRVELDSNSQKLNAAGGTLPL